MAVFQAAAKNGNPPAPCAAGGFPGKKNGNRGAFMPGGHGKAGMFICAVSAAERPVLRQMESRKKSSEWKMMNRMIRMNRLLRPPGA